MPDKYDVGLGLLKGLGAAVDSYYEADQAKRKLKHDKQKDVMDKKAQGFDTVYDPDTGEAIDLVPNKKLMGAKIAADPYRRTQLEIGLIEKGFYPEFDEESGGLKISPELKKLYFERALEDAAMKKRDFIIKSKLDQIKSGFLVNETPDGYQFMPIPKTKDEETKIDQETKKRDLEIKKLEKELSKKPGSSGLLPKMTGEERKRVDLASGSLNAINDMESAYEEIKKTKSIGFIDKIKQGSQLLDVPFRGDTKYTEARRRFQEFLGRLQSQGAIAKHEESRFSKMAPGAFDSPEIAAQKFSNLRDEMRKTLSLSGISEQTAIGAGLIRQRDTSKKTSGGGELTPRQKRIEELRKKLGKKQ